MKRYIMLFDNYISIQVTRSFLDLVGKTTVEPRELQFNWLSY
jgi:hypothetical protein